MKSIVKFKCVVRMVVTILTIMWPFVSISAYDFEAEGIYYNITSMSNLEVEVTYKSLYRSGADGAFSNDSYLFDVHIPSTVKYQNRTYEVTSIGRYAFGGFKRGGSYITNITLPSSIKKIDEGAFRECTQLSSITIPEEVVVIESSAFYNTGIRSLVFPDNLEIIGSDCFSGCNNLTRVIFGKGLKTVEEGAFVGCSKLLEVFCTNISKPNGLSLSSFSGCHSGLEIYVPSTYIYGFGKEYLTFPTTEFQYSGKSHNIEWSNNLRAYNCSLSKAEYKTEVNAGNYTTNLIATYSNGISVSVEIPFSYTIHRAPMNLIVHDAEREYGEPNPAFTCEISGFINGENEQTLDEAPTFKCEATPSSSAGEYKILASLKAPNYEIIYKYGTLSVSKAPITATVINASKIYGNPNPDFSLSFSGLKNNETIPEWSVEPTFSTPATQTSGAGVYDVTASEGVGVNYYVTNYNTGILTVNKRDLTAKANDCERLYDEDNPEFEISFIGFVNGDTEASLIQKPIADCIATKSSNSGTYPIVVKGGEASNYNFLYQDGVLKINPLTVGFKKVYNSIVYNDMSLSTSNSYFNFIPEITGPFSEEDFWIELWFLDKDNISNEYIFSITEGDYAGNYVNTNVDRPMEAGKYIFNLSDKGNNPNVRANPSRAFVTVNTASTHLKWDDDSPITVNIGEKVDLGISYHADLWCTFNTEYDETLIELSSEGANGNDPHWFVTGIKEGETTLYFNIECMKNDMGFYNFNDSPTISKLIRIVEGTGAVTPITENPESTLHTVYNLQGVLLMKTEEVEKISQLPAGVYIVNGKKIIIR